VDRLVEVLQVPEEQGEYIYDATIQRFEFTYELAWKALEMHMAYIGIADVNSPREVFREAFNIGLITGADVWTDMIKDRNLTSHVYDLDMARNIYQRIKQIYAVTLVSLRDKLGDESRQ
jgi:nucleotidyltransferase substrate binding protein (TIGR01987 family)